MTDPVADDGTASGSAPTVPFITRVRLKNYKSIASCDVSLGPLTILIGPNGSGKSNFLDALAFLSRAVARTPAEAIESRGGLREVLRRAPDQAKSFTIAIEATIPAEPPQSLRIDVSYELEIGLPREPKLRDFEVIRESCELHSNDRIWRFHVDRGVATIEDPNRQNEVASYEPDGLYLLVAARQVPFAPVFARLRAMPFFNFAPQVIRLPQLQTASANLGLRGEHLGDVLVALTMDYRAYKQRIDDYLRVIVPGLTSIDPFYAGGEYVTITLRTNTGDDGEEVEFGPQSMSEGTVRAAALLAALFQPPVLDGRIRLVGIEEPELGLHPSAAGVLFGALDEASDHVQVIAASHSADLLDREDLDPSTIRAVIMENGLTRIGEVDEASKEIAAEKLYTLGELMRRNQIVPELPEAGQ